MYCPNCGGELSNNNQKYCDLCGNKLENINSSTSEQVKAKSGTTHSRGRCC